MTAGDMLAEHAGGERLTDAARLRQDHQARPWLATPPETKAALDPPFPLLLGVSDDLQGRLHPGLSVPGH
jgi:hypothetical protein